jgi:zinc-binding alcohol dehydrogenase/oxidoreductase
MKAVVLKEKGGPDKLRIEEVPTPGPGPGEARVKLKAAALNRRDYWITQGLYPNMQYPVIAGSDGAGIVDAVGEGVDQGLVGREVVVYPARAWGDEEAAFGPEFRVLGMPDQGTFAEYICAPADDLFDRPLHLDWHESAAVPLAGLTSWRAVTTQAQVRAGQTVLITGAGSGVSTFAILWCVHLGAKVFVSSGSQGKIDRAKSLGVVDGLSYRDADCYRKLGELAGGFNAVIDSAGGDALNDILSTLRPAGRFVFFGATLGNPSVGLDLRQLFFRHARIQGTTMGSPREFRAMLHFLTGESIRPVVDRVLPMTEAVAAHRLMESFSQMGKIVLEIG